ncbi:AAA family ATPase [Desulfospira joergensenii]|uniref:AAA family ATPase n=1 Tax=Desulfospira joergensenii TaxID=53329 RepID=UPI0003B61317|nr:hypothetical protein [Desulfospira joergensenii]
MSRYFLSNIKVEGFRGINNANRPLELKFKTDSVNSVFAANALGKSSIFEALTYAIKGGIPKLDNLPAAERGADYYCNLFHCNQKSSIELTFRPDDSSGDVVISVERNPGGSKNVTSPSGHADPDGFLREISSELVFLDHKTFQKFIEDSPLDRGRSFATLLGSSQLSEYRQILNTLSNSGNINTDFKLNVLETQLDSLAGSKKAIQTRIFQNYERITGNPPADASDHQAIIQEVTKVLYNVELLKPFLKEKDITNSDYVEIRKAIKKAEGSEQREELGRTIKSIAILDRLQATSDEVTEQTQLKTELNKRADALRKTKGALFKKMYDAVQEILETDDWSDPCVCPACNSSLQFTLSEAIEENLRQYENVKQAEKDIEEIWNAATWTTRLQGLENSQILKDKDFEKQYSEFFEKYNSKKITVDDVDIGAAQLIKLEGIRTSTIKELTTQKTKIEKSLPASLVTLTQQVEYADQLKGAIKEYGDLPSATKLSEKIDIIKRWKGFIETACTLFSKAESEYVKEKTASIENFYRELYSKITQNPEIVPKLVKAEGTEHLHLKLENFYGLDGLAATTLLSESYRNAFAISLYLCAALNDKPKAQFMVLDDITSSFDAGHQYALMEMLRTDIARPSNPDGPQLIILSHDGLLEKYFDTLSGTPSWNHQRLRGLPPKGHVLTQTQQSDHLRVEAEDFLNNGDTQHAEPLIRQYLEFKILEIIRKVNIPVSLDFSIRDDRKMVKNGLDAIRAAIDLHSAANSLILEQNQVNDFDGVHVPAIVGNWVSHYATGATSSLSPYTLLGVLNTIDKVSDCFRYDCSCSGTVRRRFYKNLSKKSCKC